MSDYSSPYKEIGISANEKRGHRNRRKAEAKTKVVLPTVRDIRKAKLHEFKKYSRKFVQIDSNDRKTED